MLIFLGVSISFFPIKSIEVINTGKVFFVWGICILQRNPEPFLPSFSIVIIDFSKFESTGFENSSTLFAPQQPIFSFLFENILF